MSRARDLADGTFSGTVNADGLTVTQTGSTTATIGATGTSGDNDGTLIINNGGTGDGMLRFDYETNTDRARIGVTASTQDLIFYTAGANERARINSNGSFLVGTTSDSPASGNGLGCSLYMTTNGTGGKVEASRSGSIAGDFNRKDSTGVLVYFRYDGLMKGNISVTSTAAAYNTTSDYRLKENVTELTGAIDRVKQVPVHRFNFIADPDRTVDGFLAHEVADVVPEAITGEKDAMKTEEYEVTPAVLDDDGNVVTEAVMGTREVPDYQGIDQAKLVPLLTQALKDAITKIEALEARVATLENA